VKPIEIAFFSLAVLLPLVGGGGLLYFLWKGEKRDGDKKEK
jgi:hypothetical protein